MIQFWAHAQCVVLASQLASFAILLGERLNEASGNELPGTSGCSFQIPGRIRTP